jgi:hypothetical protein
MFNEDHVPNYASNDVGHTVAEFSHNFASLRSIIENTVIVGVVPQAVGVALAAVGIPARPEIAEISRGPSPDTSGVNIEDNSLFLFNDLNHAAWTDNVASDEPHVAEAVVGAIIEAVGVLVAPSEVGHIQLPEANALGPLQCQLPV